MCLPDAIMVLNYLSITYKMRDDHSYKILNGNVSFVVAVSKYTYIFEDVSILWHLVSFVSVLPRWSRTNLIIYLPT